MPEEPKDVVDQERRMREEEQRGREHAEGGTEDDSVGTPDGDATPAPPGNVQGANLGGAS